MSLPALGAWILYVWANIKPVCNLTIQIQPELNMIMKGSSRDIGDDGEAAVAADSAAMCDSDSDSCDRDP